MCTVRRAFLLVFRGKAELLHEGRDELHSVSMVYALPSVVRLVQQVRRPRPHVRLTRREVFVRDHSRCQYCGSTTELTLDHVLPRHRGGRHEWNNVVAACRLCNHHKGGRTPAEARMALGRISRSARWPAMFDFHAIPGALCGVVAVLGRLVRERLARTHGGAAYTRCGHRG